MNTKARPKTRYCGFYYVALCGWSDEEGNKISKWWGAAADWNAFCSRIFRSSSRVLHASLPAPASNFSSPNRANLIPLWPSLHVGYGYGNAFVYKLTHAKNRSKEDPHTNIQINISSSILNGIARFKRQNDLCSTIYLNHMLISRIEEFEFLPSWSAARDSVFVSLRLMKTDGV